MTELRYQAELGSDELGDILQVGFSRNFRGEGDLVVKDAIRAVERIEERGQSLRGKCLRIDGPQSIAVSYALSHKLSHLYETIAVLDPKIGRRGYKTFIVTSSHGTAEVGSLIETKEPQVERNSVKLALCGPPHSGKSCLRDGLRSCVLGMLNAPYPYTIPGCPDGEPAGFQEIKELDSVQASILKQEYKNDFTEAFTKQTVRAVECTSNLLNIIDLGGIRSEENKLILAKCTHAIILAGDSFDRHLTDWEAFCQEVNVPVIAKIHSDLDAYSDRIDTELPLTGTIHKLQGNGQDLMSRPIIKALANLAIDLTFVK